MEGRKITVKDDPTNYVVYYPFPCTTLPPVGLDIPDGGCQTVSIDPAPKNFAVRIEKRYRTGYIEPVYMETTDFSQYGDASETTGTTVIDPRMIWAISHYINSLLPLIKESRIVAIERQLAKNYKATRIFQHLLTHFIMVIPNFTHYCILTDISPKLKGKILQAPKNLNYNGLKKWGIEKAIEILTIRNDQWSLAVIKSRHGKSQTKADDLADTVIQMEAWFILVGGISTQAPQTISLGPPLTSLYAPDWVGAARSGLQLEILPSSFIQ
jgi:hypothetical protein